MRNQSRQLRSSATRRKPDRGHYSKKRPRDPVLLATLIGDIAAGQVEDNKDQGKNPAAVELGRLGGVRAHEPELDKLSVIKSQEIARKAVRARWSSNK